MQHNMKRLIPGLTLLLSLSSVAASDQPHGSWKDAKVTDVTAYAAGGPAGTGYHLERLLEAASMTTMGAMGSCVTRTANLSLSMPRAPFRPSEGLSSMTSASPSMRDIPSSSRTSIVHRNGN